MMGRVWGRSGALGCLLHPDSTSCTVGLYMPSPPSCSVSIQVCTGCPPPPRGMDFMLSNAGFGAQVCRVGCAAGYFWNSGACQPCSPGWFKGWAGNDTQCLGCSEGSYAPASGSSGCTSCPPFSITAPGGAAASCQCLPGTVTNGTAFCVQCPPGYISSGGVSCTQCAAGSVWTPSLQ